MALVLAWCAVVVFVPYALGLWIAGDEGSQFGVWCTGAAFAVAAAAGLPAVAVVVTSLARWVWEG